MKKISDISELPRIEYLRKNIAEKIKNPRAHRAVANANATNPIPIVIPCHRVIQSNGELGKYGGGKGLKHSLIEKEKNSNMLN